MSDAGKTAISDEFLRFVDIVRELRRACPWDKVQTPSTLIRYLIEETYEAVAAIESGDPRALADELGDLLLQIVLQTTIAEETQSFDLAGLIHAASDKLVRRHPHVFGSTPARDAAEVAARWEEIKREERRFAGFHSELDAIPNNLPALLRAEKIGSRARHAGMDWADLRGVLAKVREELAEVEQALDLGRPDEAAAELGDALLALANAPRFLDASAEECLRIACNKFVRRFRSVEEEAQATGRRLNDMTPDEIDAAWTRAKARESPK